MGNRFGSWMFDEDLVVLRHEEGQKPKGRDLEDGCYLEYLVVLRDEERNLFDSCNSCCSVFERILSNF